jgi:hypothetical protein
MTPKKICSLHLNVSRSTSVLSLFTPKVVLKNEIKSGKQNLGNMKSCFVGEVIVAIQCVLNCWPLRVWFPELSKTPYITGGK